MSTEEKQKYYKKNMGKKCPECHSKILHCAPFNFQPNIISQRIWCNDCQHYWEDIYHFFRYNDK